MRILVALILVSLACSSCIPTIIGASVYKSTKTRAGKEQFLSQFNQTNIEREREGLQPLDLCTEKYNYDKKWADNDPICEARIRRYESGDATALGQPQIDTTKLENPEDDATKLEDPAIDPESEVTPP